MFQNNMNSLSLSMLVWDYIPFHFSLSVLAREYTRNMTGEEKEKNARSA